MRADRGMKQDVIVGAEAKQCSQEVSLHRLSIHPAQLQDVDWNASFPNPLFSPFCRTATAPH